MQGHVIGETFFEDSRRIRTGSLMNFLNFMQKNAWKGRRSWRKLVESCTWELVIYVSH
jgi:hypothetical protein